MAQQARRGGAWRGEAKQARPGAARQGAAWRGRQGRQGPAWPGQARRGRQSNSRLTTLQLQQTDKAIIMSKSISKAATDEVRPGQISPPNLRRVRVTIVGTANYVANKFSGEAREMMAKKQAAGSQAKKKGEARPGKDFDACYRGSMHTDSGGRPGIPASTFRQAMVSACRLVGFKMTIAKLSVFVVADGVDVDDGSPIVFFTKGTPHRVDSYVRNETGVADIRPRAHWDAGWESDLVVEYDADTFAQSDVVNLLMRVGKQVGIGAGRPDSKQSCGQGWGTFDVSRVVALDPAAA